MISDDTEHTVFVAQSLLAHPHEVSGFQRRLAWCLRLWLVSLPAGIGFATLRAILRLWVGFGPNRSGVFSAGNGPAMRAAPIGAFFAGDPARREEYVAVSTRLTHTDPKALVGAGVVARLAAWLVREGLAEKPPVEALVRELHDADSDPEWRDRVARMATAARSGTSVPDFARSLGLTKGVTGYVHHTVPVAVYAWYRHFGDFEATLSAALDCGGDTDTVGAIAGALAGAVTGEEGIPGDWLSGLCDWPRSRRLLTRIADRLEAAARGEPAASGPVGYFWPALAVRNLVFLVVVVLHGFRRLAPPY
jgi:ADP-ribosyl-[dinitrogen reductase] hydrolase